MIGEVTNGDPSFIPQHGIDASAFRVELGSIRGLAPIRDAATGVVVDRSIAVQLSLRMTERLSN